VPFCTSRFTGKLGSAPSGRVGFWGAAYLALKRQAIQISPLRGEGNTSGRRWENVQESWFMDKTLPPDIPIESLADFCRQNQVQELPLFGSSVTGSFGEKSDVDLLVTFQPGTRVGFLTLARMQRELEGLLGRKVDLVPKEGLKPVIRDSVLASARVLYES
jgi:uncharacterized protein